MRIEDFVFPYGEMDPENDWVKLAALVLVGYGGGAICRAVRQQRSTGTPVPGGAGIAGDPATAEVQRPVAGETYRRKSVSAIFHWDERVWSVPFRSVHFGGVSETVQRRRYGSYSGGIRPYVGEKG